MKVGLNGLEPSTSRLSGVRSNQLSYRPNILGTSVRYYLNEKIRPLKTKQSKYECVGFRYIP